MDAPIGGGGAWAWHAGRWLLSLALGLLPLWVGPWPEQRPDTGAPPLELSLVRLPAAAPGSETSDTETSDTVTPPSARPPRLPDPAPPSAPASSDSPFATPLEQAALPMASPPNATGPAPRRAAPPPVVDPSADMAALAAPATPASSNAPQDAAPGSSAQPVNAEALDAGFRLLSRGPLTYPSRARRLGRGGEARVEVAVDPGGRVTRVTVLHETRGWGFGAAAREAYAQARFTRPTVNGRPVHVRWRKTLRFQP